MGENGFSFSPISRHFLSFLPFLDTFSLILDTKVSRNGNGGKGVTNAGTKQPFRCLDSGHDLDFKRAVERLFYGDKGNCLALMLSQ